MTTPRPVLRQRPQRPEEHRPEVRGGQEGLLQNALKHGLTAEDAVLPNEDPTPSPTSRVDRPRPAHRPRPGPPPSSAPPRQVEARPDRQAGDRRCPKRSATPRGLRPGEGRRGRGGRPPADSRAAQPLAPSPDPRPGRPAPGSRPADDNPAVLARQLQTTAQGVQWLIDRWMELGEMLELHGFWHYPEKSARSGCWASGPRTCSRTGRCSGSS